MSHSTSTSLGRCTLVWVGATAVAGGVTAWLAPGLGHLPDARNFDAWLVAGCEVATVLCVIWLWALVTVVAVDAARGAPGPRRGVPRAVRRAVLAGCGVGLTAAGLVAPAHADDRTPTPSPPAAAVLSGLPLPDRATAGPTAVHVAEPVAAPRQSREVVVAPGDTLWSLAAADLGPGADAALVDAHWRAIHAANRQAIGVDPDLIYPGTRLRLPPVPHPEFPA